MQLPASSAPAPQPQATLARPGLTAADVKAARKTLLAGLLGLHAMLFERVGSVGLPARLYVYRMLSLRCCCPSLAAVGLTWQEWNTSNLCWKLCRLSPKQERGPLP